jgi:sRNA-binding protein
MSEKTPPETDASQRKAEVERQAAERARRSAEQLRANLQRRKAQARAKRSGDADMRPDGLAATKDTPPKDGDRDKDGLTEPGRRCLEPAISMR